MKSRARAKARSAEAAPLVLITGASSGLGLAIARRLQRENYRLLVTARDASLARFEVEGLIPGPRLLVRPLDVTSAAQRRALIDEATALGGVDVLINNAGVSYRAVVEHVVEHEQHEQMNINFEAPMELTRLVLPEMRRKQRGHIINISSVGGMMAMPTMATYSASKFALEGASEALWYEVRPWNIFVSLVQPGFINSSSVLNVRFTRLGQTSSQHPGDPYYMHYASMEPFIRRLMARAFATPESIAERVLKTMRQRRPPLRVPATLDAYLFYLLRRYVPRRFYHPLLYFALPQIRRWGPHQ